VLVFIIKGYIKDFIENLAALGAVEHTLLIFGKDSCVAFRPSNTSLLGFRWTPDSVTAWDEGSVFHDRRGRVGVLFVTWHLQQPRAS
jgi:hypothetical protein